MKPGNFTHRENVRFCSSSGADYGELVLLQWMGERPDKRGERQGADKRAKEEEAKGKGEAE